MDHRLLDIIACPVCKSKLYFDKENLELICKPEQLAYPIRNGIPILLKRHARDLSEQENVMNDSPSFNQRSNTEKK